MNDFEQDLKEIYELLGVKSHQAAIATIKILQGDE